MNADESPRDDVPEEAGSATEPVVTDAEAAQAGASAAGDIHAEGGGASGTADGGADAEAAAEPGEGEEFEEEDALEGEPAVRPRPAWRTPAFAATRAVVVAAVAVVGYLFVVPQTHVDRNRMARLVVTETGLPTFPGKAAQSQSEQVSGSGLKSLEAINKTHPDATGIWVSEWAGAGASGSDQAAVVVFVTPSSSDAGKVVGDLRPQTVDAKTSNQSYSRSATFTTSGVPGSDGAVYTNSSPQAGQPSRLASILWQQGKVVSLVEQAGDAGTQEQTESLARRQAAVLRSKEPGFTQKVTTYPTDATIVWVAGALVVLILITGGPILIGRRRRRKEAELQALLEAQVRGHSGIAKRRRSVASPGGQSR